MCILKYFKRFGKRRTAPGKKKVKFTTLLLSTLTNPLVCIIHLVCFLRKWNLRFQFCKLFSFKLIIFTTDHFHI